jgi:hypothetical protein
MTEEQKENEITLNEQFMVLAVPERTLEVVITAKVWNNGDVIEVSKTMSYEEVRVAFNDADRNYIPEDAIFTLTDIGKEELARLKAEQLAKFNEEMV